MSDPPNRSLETSRSSRIVWLLEELGLDYSVKAYSRKSGASPASIKEIWPIGTFPVVQVFEDGKTVTLAESGHIMNYLVQHYDKAGKLTPAPADQVLVDYYLHFAEGSLQLHFVTLFVGFLFTRKATAEGKAVVEKMQKLYTLERLLTGLRFLDTQLSKKGGGFFVGDKLSLADIMLDFPINDNLFLGGLLGMYGVEDPEEMFPNLYKWHLLTKGLPNRVKALEREQLLEYKL